MSTLAVTQGGTTDTGPTEGVLATASTLSPVLGYVRVSTEEQALSGLGLDAQRAAIERACSQRHWGLVDVLVDDGYSGANVNRPGLTALLRRLDEGEASILVISKLDRLSRSLLDFATLMERAQRNGWGLVALDLGVDMTTPSGRLVANVMAAVAQWEREMIGVRTREAMARLRARGVVLGRPRTVPEDVRAYVRELRAEGLTWRAVAARLEAEGVPTGQGGSWHAQTARRIALSTRRIALST